MTSPRLVMTTCICCEICLSAMSPDALTDAMREHTDYVNAVKNLATDVHFEDARLTALVQA
jgi:hypothetical protein